MFALFRALTDRLKALFITTAALDFEADLLARDAERKAELLHRADRYDADGRHGIAEHLRRQADSLSLQQPLAGVLPAVEHLLGTDDARATPLLQSLPAVDPPRVMPLPVPPSKPRKKGK